MILKKLINALRKQDWSAIFIEILIVALGIYLGVQANNWQAQQSDLARERQLINRLTEDLRNLQKSNNRILDIYEQQLRQYDDTINFASQQDSWQKSHSEWRRYIKPLMGYPDPVTKLPVYDEIVATAKLGLIQNDELRLELIRFNQLLDTADTTNKDVLRLYSEGYKKLFHLMVDFEHYHDSINSVYDHEKRRDIIRHLYLMKRNIEVVKVFTNRINGKANELLALVN